MKKSNDATMVALGLTGVTFFAPMAIYCAVMGALFLAALFGTLTAAFWRMRSL